MTKVAFKTLGCRLNQYETDALATQFVNNGYEVSNDIHGADVVVVNTCTVTNQSNQKSRNAISQAERINPDARVIITGCMVESHKEQLLVKFPGATLIDNKGKSAIFHSIDSLLKSGAIDLSDQQHDLFSYQSFTEMFHTRSLIKIQDGCDNFCTYCIIPFVRGRAISRPVNDVLANAREVIEKGAKELVLTGVNISRYQHESTRFSGLVEKILNLSGDFRVRISSIEPDCFDGPFYNLIGHPKLAPHLHLCLQSGSERILKLMRRMYTVEEFLQIVEKVRERDARFNFTTDAIVGFPGESDEDFAETINIARKVKFGHMHIFKYSVRQGTKAQKMPDQIPDKVKTERSKLLHTVSEELKKEYRAPFNHTVQKILVERWKEGYALGYNEYYVPMRFATDNKAHNRFETVLAEVKDFGDQE